MESKETAIVIYKTLGRNTNEIESTNVINAIHQRINDCVSDQTKHLQDQIDSYNKWDVIQTTKINELQEELEKWQKDYSDLQTTSIGYKSELIKLREENEAMKTTLELDVTHIQSQQERIKELEKGVNKIISGGLLNADINYLKQLTNKQG